jgi:hypothetical protein
MRALVAVAALATATGIGSATARADAWAHIGEGAPFYVSARPVALFGALQRLGVSDLPAVQRLRRQMGGIDPFNPALLAAPGIDVAAPLGLQLFEPAGRNLTHSRGAATLRDPQVFAAFLDALTVTGQVKLSRVEPGSPLAKQGVTATGSFGSSSTLIIRVQGGTVIADLVSSMDQKTRVPAPAEVARRYPSKPLRPFAATRGARRLFAPESAAVVYADGRRLQPFVQMMAEDDNRRELRWASPGQKPAVVARQRALDQRCSAWNRAPTTFDDAAVALTAAPDALTVSWAWGTQAGPPLGGLKLAPVDETGLDPELLARDATMVLTFYAASAAPFLALKHTGPFASGEALNRALDGCDARVGLPLLVRSWPNAFAALAVKSGGPSPFGGLQPSLTSVRNVVLALRDAGARTARFAIATTYDPAARPTVEPVLAASGKGAVTTLGARSPTVYSLLLPGFPRRLTAALETLTGGRLGLTVADSDDSLGWAYRASEPPAPAASPQPAGARTKPPVARVAADMAAVARLGPLFRADRDEQGLLDMLAHLRHVDGEVTADGDLLRLTVRAPLKQ